MADGAIDGGVRHTHYRSCNLCEAMCGVAIEHDGERVLAIRGDERDPFSRGYICPKATGLRAIHEDPDRLRTPMRRVGDRFEPISWKKAYEEAARGLLGVQEKHGKDAVGIYLGNPNVHNVGAMLYGPMLIRGLRTKNRFSATSVDQLPHMAAAYEMFGHQLLLPIPDVDRTDLFVIFGANPLASNGSIMSAPGMRNRLAAIRERGGEVIVFDPRRTETARAATEYHAIRPGTDAMVMMAILHVLFRDGLVRLGHLGARVDGVGTLREAARTFSPERVAPASGVDAAVIESLARKLGTTERAAFYSRLGACTQRFGGVAAWLTNAINALTGHLDTEGGLMITHPAIDTIAAAFGFGVGKGSFGRWKSRVRGYPEFGGELPVATLADELLTSGEGQIRAMVTMAGNPTLSTPNGRKLDGAFEDLDFYVAIDPYLNETTRHANIILPPCSPLEHAHYDLAFHLLAVRNTAKFGPRLFAPPGGQPEDGAIVLQLLEAIEAERYGALSKQRLKFRALRAVGLERTLDIGLRIGPYGKRPGNARGKLDLATLRRKKHGVDLGPLRRGLLARMPKRAVDVAPARYVADLARLEAALEESQDTLLLIGRRQLRSNNSWLHNAPQLTRGKRRCTLMMNPDDAARAKVSDGERVFVRSRVGAVEVEVEVTDAMMPGVVSLPHGYGHDRSRAQLSVASRDPGVSINDLTDDAEVDPLTGNAVLNGVPVTVRGATKGKRKARKRA